MNKREAWCPRCECDVEVTLPWKPFECPVCNLKGYWDEQCTEDHSDCWEVADWKWDYYEKRPLT